MSERVKRITSSPPAFSVLFAEAAQVQCKMIVLTGVQRKGRRMFGTWSEAELWCGSQSGWEFGQCFWLCLCSASGYATGRSSKACWSCGHDAVCHSLSYEAMYLPCSHSAYTHTAVCVFAMLSNCLVAIQCIQYKYHATVEVSHPSQHLTTFIVQEEAKLSISPNEYQNFTVCYYGTVRYILKGNYRGF